MVTTTASGSEDGARSSWERVRERAREGEIDPNGSGGWRGATEGSGRFREAGGGSHVDARGEHVPSSSWQGRKTTGRRPVGWAGELGRPGKWPR